MNTTGNSFTGSYQYSLDSKGRINIPAKMRKALDPANDSTFVATRGYDSCVTLYPIEVWKRFEKKLLALNKGRATNRHYIRNFVRHAEILQYDSQGRVAIPSGLKDYADITKQVVIVGMIEWIEVWDSEKLKAMESRLDQEQDELSAIADEVNF